MNGPLVRAKVLDVYNMTEVTDIIIYDPVLTSISLTPSFVRNLFFPAF